MTSEIPDETEAIAREIVDAGFRVHTALGPGLLESAYEHCLAHEITKRGVVVRRQVPMPIRYDGVCLDVGYRLDMLVGESVIVEIKATESLLPIHQAQLLTYLRLSSCRLGFLMTFNVKLFKSGIKRMIL